MGLRDYLVVLSVIILVNGGVSYGNRELCSSRLEYPTGSFMWREDVPTTIICQTTVLRIPQDKLLTMYSSRTLTQVLPTTTITVTTTIYETLTTTTPNPESIIGNILPLTTAAPDPQSISYDYVRDFVQDDIYYDYEQDFVQDVSASASAAAAAAHAASSSASSAASAAGVTSGVECDCHLEPDITSNHYGCTIINKAPPNTACKCHNTGFVCTGTVVECADPSSEYCKHPDTSYDSCLQAPGGNCKGYYCDCHVIIYGFLQTGCIIKKIAPPNFACKCSDDSLSCSGTIVHCADPSSEHCKHPDTSLASCMQAPGGDCSGYGHQ